MAYAGSELTLATADRRAGARLQRCERAGVLSAPPREAGVQSPANDCAAPLAQGSESAVVPQLAVKADAPKADPLTPEPSKPRSRTSTSQVPWAELMRRTLGINVLCCPVCSATMVLLAVITKQEVISRILTHVRVPLTALTTDQEPALYYDVTGEPAASWVIGVDPDPDERAPPTDYDVVDPPAPDM